LDLLDDPAYLIALDAGNGWSGCHASVEGVMIHVLAVIRPDGRTQVTAEIEGPRVPPHTEFWMFDALSTREALRQGMRRARHALTAMLDASRSASAMVA